MALQIIIVSDKKWDPVINRPRIFFLLDSSQKIFAYIS